ITLGGAFQFKNFNKDVIIYTSNILSNPIVLFNVTSNQTLCLISSNLPFTDPYQDILPVNVNFAAKCKASVFVTVVNHTVYVINSNGNSQSLNVTSTNDLFTI